MGGKITQPNRTKEFQSAFNDQISYSCVSMQGWESQMQNFSLTSLKLDFQTQNGNSIFAIFDGVRGIQVSRFLQQTFISVFVNSQSYVQGNYEQALKYTFQKIDQLLRSEKGEKRLKQIRAQNDGEAQIVDEIISDITGCMASVIFITKKKIYAAHIGDSKSYLMKDKNAVALFQNHKPEDFEEKIRIQKAGGQVSKGRINGNLSLSRAFGFFKFKQNQALSWGQQMVTCLPTIKIMDRNISDQFIFMACDGIWGTYEKNETSLIKKIKQFLNQNPQKHKECIQQIMDTSISQTADNQNDIGAKNMTGILIKFNEI